MTNVIDLVDQIHFLGEQATGTSNVLQCVWVYDRTIDVDGVRRFHHHLERGRLARRIERSPVPCGRHRWVTPGRSSGLEIVARARSRAEFDAWLDEQASTPLDCEHGPEWHLAVLPFAEGGAGISLVISHCLTDGVGLCEALADAADGLDDVITWPAAQSRSRWRALREDSRQTMRDIPAISRAITAGTRTLLRSQSRDGSGTPAPDGTQLPFVGTDELVTVPTATVFVDAQEWYGRAQTLRGTGNALLVGLAARLAHRMGRVAADGSAVVAIPVNDRVPGDTRANAITGIDITVDPLSAATDLQEIRAATKHALTHRQEVPDERFALLPIVPLVPKWLVKRMIGLAVGNTTTASSNLGVVNPAANRPDGTDADYFAMKMRYPSMTKATMHHTGGLLSLLSGITHGRVFVSVVAYQPGNMTDELQQMISDTLSDFSLTCTTNWRSPEFVAAG
ncbi:hypothetical protein [Mycobacterium sp. 1245801.1]|uniref:hypothetical protein n=1 Tax=Mycobacterium sp. 1245801.1 TaxID=1834075 RepID=UPI0007FD6387|nr:hypothetical protein [Mycobacterium sp. 1245801.1]OBJ25478.1 hypothetical protein A5622_09765 [Mycobacterium sp. 1245801.1]